MWYCVSYVAVIIQKAAVQVKRLLVCIMKQIYIAFLLLLVSCQGVEPNKLDRQNATLQKDSSALFDPKLEFEIIRLKLSTSQRYSAEDTSMCSEWSLDQNEAIRVIKGFEPIDVHTRHHTYDHLPCTVDGQLRQGNKQYDYSINAESWLIISDADTFLIFGDNDKEFEMMFRSSIWTEEDEKN